MSIQVFFNKPARPIPTNILIADISMARNALVMASAWFTSIPIATAFVSSPARRKGVILNQADLDRPNPYGNIAVDAIKAYFNDVYFADISYDADPDSQPWEGLAVLGTGDWKEGVMHHKFLVADAVVWTGSYNFTFQAARNYENILRISDLEIASLYLQEAAELFNEDVLFSLDDGRDEFSNNAFRCCDCRKLFPINDLGNSDFEGSHGGMWYECKSCAAKAGGR
jgi:phosphatidylserine/phosphatidylglycerophosphate/cardiolipin synthase-like enzyme